MLQSREMGRLTKELCQASAFRKSATDAMRRMTQATLTACATMRGQMVHEYRAQTHKFLASLASDVAVQRRDTAHQIAQTRKFLSSMAKNVAAGRRVTMNQIARSTAARCKAGDQMRGNLERQVSFIMNKAADLRNAAADAVAELASAHRRMAKQQKTALKSGRRKLRGDTARFVNAIHADRMKAHDIWSAFKLGGAA